MIVLLLMVWETLYGDWTLRPLPPRPLPLRSLRPLFKKTLRPLVKTLRPLVKRHFGPSQEILRPLLKDTSVPTTSAPTTSAPWKNTFKPSNSILFLQEMIARKIRFEKE